MTEPTPEEIANGLTEVQKQILLKAPLGGWWFPVCWEGWRILRPSLQRAGLAYPREPGLQVLSPLGLAVRATLEGSQSDD